MKADLLLKGSLKNKLRGMTGALKHKTRLAAKFGLRFSRNVERTRPDTRVCTYDREFYSRLFPLKTIY